MADVQLTKDNFVDQITRYGYFSEIIPECFCSDKLADQITDVISSVKTTKGKKGISAPVSLSTYKSAINRRIISVPNPESFLRLVKFMAENWDGIKKYLKARIRYLRLHVCKIIQQLQILKKLIAR